MRHKKEELKRVVRSILGMLELCIFAWMFSFVWNNYYSQGLWIEPFYDNGNWIIVLIYLAILVLIFAILGGFKIGHLRKTNVILSQCIGVIVVNMIMYMQMILLYRKLPAIVPLLVMTLVECVVILVLVSVFCAWLDVLFPQRKLLIIYDGNTVQSIASKIQSRSDKFVIEEQIHVKETWENIEKTILKYRDGGVLISDVHAEMRNRILKFCYAQEIRVYVTPKISDIMLRNSEVLHIFDTPLLLIRNTGLSMGQKILKRILDIVVSMCMLVVTSPLMLVAAVLIKCYDGGPVLFKQKRLTIDRKEFFIYKFRSMIVDAEKDGVARLATEHDKRITPVGHFIRATRLDELPQLINILKGDMSLVGPRPERPEIAVEYEKEIPEFAYRLRVKAGLTGYAQIYGKYNTTAYDKLKLDLMYIEGYNILTDLKLILTTIKVVFMKDSTEGLEEGKTISKTGE